jgi:hypothetical protein
MSRVLSVVTNAQLDSASNEPLAVILFMIPHCPHCMKFMPGFNSASIDRAFANVSFYSVNIAAGEGLQLARRNNVRGVPHATFYTRGRRLGDIYGDSIEDFRKNLTKHQSERNWSGAGHTLGARPGGSEPPRAMGGSRGSNADALEQLAPPQDKVLPPLTRNSLARRRPRRAKIHRGPFGTLRRPSPHDRTPHDRSPRTAGRRVSW